VIALKQKFNFKDIHKSEGPTMFKES